MPDLIWEVYKERKRIIYETSKTSEEYERRIHELVKELRI